MTRCYFILWQTTTGQSLECCLPVPAAIRHDDKMIMNGMKTQKEVGQEIRSSTTAPMQFRETYKPYHMNITAKANDTNDILQTFRYSYYHHQCIAIELRRHCVTTETTFCVFHFFTALFS